MNHKIIVALDVTNIDTAIRIVDDLGGSIQWYKIGSVLFTKYGPEIIKAVKDWHGKRVMLDLKYHDIPNTVEMACENAADMGVDMLTIHLSGGRDMIDAACNGVAGTQTKVLGISILTSHTNSSIAEVGMSEQLNIHDHIRNLVSLGIDCGTHGIVCSPRETKFLRNELGDGFDIVNPGIRLKKDASHDQKRITGPKEAFDNGANFIVVGRSIIMAKNPRAKVQEYRAIISGCDEPTQEETE